MNIIAWFESKFGDLLRIVGIVLAAQGVISQYFSSLGVQPRILTAIFGGLGLLMMVSGKYIDSKSFTAITVSGAAHYPVPSVVVNNSPPAPSPGA